MNRRGSFLAYQSFSRLFPSFSRLSQQVPPLLTGKPLLSPRQYGGLSMSGTRNFSVGFPLLSTADHSEKSEQQDEVPRSHERTVFVTNFHQPITEETLRDHFSRFGEIVRFDWARTKLTKRTRGFAFVTYKNEEDYENVLRQPHELNGRQLVVKKSRPIQLKAGTTCTAVHVQNVDAKLRKEDLLEHFSKYGTVVAIDWPVDSVTNTKRDHCFVQFSSEGEVEEATKDENQSLGDREVLVEKSTSRVCKTLETSNRLVVYADAAVESIAAYFCKFGEIQAIWGNFTVVGPSSCVIPMFSVLFKNRRSVQEISKQSHFINGQEVFTLRSVQRAVLTYPFERKIVVDHLPEQVSAESIIQHFQQFGYVKHCYFTKDPRNGQKLNCTITFDKQESVRKAVIEENQSICGKQVRIQRVGYRHVDNTAMDIISATSSMSG